MRALARCAYAPCKEARYYTTFASVGAGVPYQVCSLHSSLVLCQLVCSVALLYAASSYYAVPWLAPDKKDARYLGCERKRRTHSTSSCRRVAARPLSSVRQSGRTADSLSEYRGSSPRTSCLCAVTRPLCTQRGPAFLHSSALDTQLLLGYSSYFVKQEARESPIVLLMDLQVVPSGAQRQASSSREIKTMSSAGHLTTSSLHQLLLMRVSLVVYCSNSL